MQVVRITTWNVLHRVHAANWSEGPVEAFPDEAVRIARISRLIAVRLEAGDQIVCLQEVSGDQLASLRRSLRANVEIFDHLYPRLPKVRGGPAVLEDATEHLVTIVSSFSARRVGGRTFDTDPGKGMLAVELDGGIQVINTHVSFGPRSAAQLAGLTAAADEAVGGAIMVGDFNAPASDVQAALGAPFQLSDLRGQRATRVATPHHPGRTIDHIAVRGGEIEIATVLDDEQLSDHAPVAATVRFALASA